MTAYTITHTHVLANDSNLLLKRRQTVTGRNSSRMLKLKTHTVIARQHYFCVCVCLHTHQLRGVPLLDR